MGSPHGAPPPDPAPVVVAEPEPVPEPVPEVEDEDDDVPDLIDDEDVPVARSAALIEEALNATLEPEPIVTTPLAPAPSVYVKK